MTELTILMYHYVRPLEGTPYPRLNALRLTDFRAQLAHIEKTYRVVTVAEVIHSVRTGDALPPMAALLTFDDGYRDHFSFVFPILHDKGFQGAFFLPVLPIKKSQLLDVNRIHFVLAAVQNPRILMEEVDHHVRSLKDVFDLESPETYRSKWEKPSRFDDAATNYVKKMLQVGLPKGARQQVASKLFKTYVTDDEMGFARDLYMEMSQLETMLRDGMYVGSHAYSHSWLDSLSREEQAEELDASLAFLRELGSPVDDFWVMCYPYGAWNDTLLGELRARNCSLGLTAESRVARLGQDDPLTLPRLDTNDVPRELFNE